MNRADFFRVMGTSLRDTLKQVSAPFIEEDWEKLQTITDELAGVKWFVAGNREQFAKDGIYERFIGGKNIIIVKNDKQFIAFEKICPSCNSLLQWLDFDKQFKCFLCDQSFSLSTIINEQQIQLFPVKLVKNELSIDLNM